MMSFAVPPVPTHEGETTQAVVPADVSPETLETAVVEIFGRVNIIDGMMLRDMPDGILKAKLAYKWGTLFAQFEAAQKLFGTGSAGGIRFLDGTLLSPDLALWDLKDPNRRYPAGVAEHLMRHAPAPNWVLEYEWRQQVGQQNKGIDKVVNNFFVRVGLNNTTVDEAWILVKTQDVPLAPEPRHVHYLVRWLRAAADIWMLGLFISAMLSLLDVLTRSNQWSGVVLRKDMAPADQQIPYIMVFFRAGTPKPYGFYHFHWHEKFYAPPGSVYHGAPPLDTDKLLKMMQDNPL